MSKFPVPPLPRFYGMESRQRREQIRDYIQDEVDDVFLEESSEREQYAKTLKNYKLANIAREAPRTPWSEFLTELEWKNGEHFALIGPTGQGKTTMLMNLLPLHPYVTVFATKPRDKSMDRLIDSGYVKVDRWRSLDATYYPRRVLWPDASALNANEYQQDVFHDAFQRIYREGGWTLAIDELWYIVNILKLGQDVKVYLLQARALGISLLCATQRPAFVPLEIYDQSTHLMFWRDNDEANLNRLKGISYKNSRVVRDIISDLEDYQVLYLNTRTGRMLRTRCPSVE